MKPKEKSFSALVKEAAKELPIKKGCCRHAFADALSLESRFPDDAAKMICGEDFRCPSCAMNYIRGLFAVYGNVTSPEKAYHLEFSAETEELCEALVSLLEKQGMIFRRTKRKGRFIAYIKDSEKIEDFLCCIGLNSFAFDFMNSKIVREIRNNANRQVNCDSANIEKSRKKIRFGDRKAYFYRNVQRASGQPQGGCPPETRILRGKSRPARNEIQSPDHQIGCEASA